jgi:hypothetical protein
MCRELQKPGDHRALDRTEAGFLTYRFPASIVVAAGLRLEHLERPADMNPVFEGPLRLPVQGVHSRVHEGAFFRGQPQGIVG